MTIALGIIAPDGIVVAADRQAAAGYQKADEGKLRLVWHADLAGSLVTTGAGDSAYLDSIADRPRGWFGSSKLTDIKKIGAGSLPGHHPD